MKICIAGKNNIAVNILEYIIKEIKIDKQDLLVITNSTDIGKDHWQRSLKKYSIEKKIRIVKLKDVYDIEDLIFLSLEFDKIIKTEKFKSNKLYNIHFSLLPKYRGMYTSVFPLLNNEPYTGVTFHKIDNGIDTGDIIGQYKFPISFYDNSKDLYLKYINAGTKLIKSLLQDIINGKRINRFNQNHKKATYYSKSSLSFAKITIDLNQTAINIHNQIRAFTFKDYQLPNVFSSYIISSEILESSSNLKPGRIIFEDDRTLLVSTIDNNIVLYKDRFDDLLLCCQKNDVNQFWSLATIPKILTFQNEEGWTPLIVAVYNNNIEIALSLISLGVDIMVTNYKGTNLLMYAKSAFVRYNDSTMIELCKNLDIDVFQKDFASHSVLDYCIKNNELEAFEEIKSIYRIS